MAKNKILIIILTSMLEGLISQPQPVCINNQDAIRSMTISFRSKKNETGHWMDNLTAQAIVNETSDNFAVNLTHSAISCDGKRVITIRGISGAPLPDDTAKVDSDIRNRDKLLFHRRCGKNVVVVNSGRTLRKKIESEYTYTAGLTNRPLKDNEIFQVRLNEISGKDYIQIGVINENPENVEILTDMYKQKNAWVYYYNSLCKQASCNTRSDGLNLTEFKVGETVGVMRTGSGDLHLFFDGVDMGVGASNIPSTVYGMFELYKLGLRATIDYP